MKILMIDPLAEQATHDELTGVVTATALLAPLYLERIWREREAYPTVYRGVTDTGTAVGMSYRYNELNVTMDGRAVLSLPLRDMASGGVISEAELQQALAGQVYWPGCFPSASRLSSAELTAMQNILAKEAEKAAAYGVRFPDFSGRLALTDRRAREPKPLTRYAARVRKTHGRGQTVRPRHGARRGVRVRHGGRS